jgi:hypothetical protein
VSRGQRNDSPTVDSYFIVQFSRIYVSLTTVLLKSPNGKRTILMWTILHTIKVNNKCGLIFVTLFVANMTNLNGILSDIKPCFYRKKTFFTSAL